MRLICPTYTLTDIQNIILVQIKYNIHTGMTRKTVWSVVIATKFIRKVIVF